MIDFTMIVRRRNLTIEATGRLEKGITILSGPSGAGKSTIIKVLAGLLVPDQGRIVVGDTCWMDRERHIYLKPQKRNVGYMPQGNIIFPHLSVKNNILYSKKGDFNLYRHIIESLGLEKYENRKASHLSGGEQQRVALGRALYLKPSFLLLDEPLSALDPHLREQVGQDIVRVIRDWHIPCLWVTHDTSLMKAKEYRHWHMKEGKLIVE